MQDCETKIKIRRVAESLFAQKGFHAVSIRDIARQAEVNISMINYYFKTKDNLLTDIINQMELLLENVQDVARLEGVGSAIKIKRYCSILTDIFFEHPNVIFVLIQQLSTMERFGFSFKRNIAKLRQVLLSNLSKIISEEDLDGDFRHRADHKLLIKTVLGILCAELVLNRPLFFSRKSHCIKARIVTVKIDLQTYISKFILNQISITTPEFST